MKILAGNWKPLFTVCLIFWLAGCGEQVQPTVTKTIDAGVITGVSHTPETFTDWAKTSVTTDKGVFVIGGTKSFWKGDSVHIELYDNGEQYVCFSSSDSCYKIWGS